MKKLLAIFLSVFIMALMASNSFALTLASLKDIKYVKSGSQDKITVYSSNYKGFKAFYLPNPDRLVVDIPNNNVTVNGSGTIKINSSMIRNVRFSQFTKTSARVVFDLNGKQSYTIEQKSGALTFIFGKASSPAVKAPEANRGDADRPAAVVHRLSYSSEENADKLIIPGGNHAGYRTMRLTNPDRIVVDIPNCTVPQDQNEIPGNMNLVKNIRYTQLNATTARIVAETNGHPKYRIDDQQDQLILYVETPTYRNIIYTVQDDTASLILKGARLEEIIPAESADGAVDGTAAEAVTHNPFYSETIDVSGKSYAISFSAQLADVGSGILQIGDNFLDTIVISNDLDYNTHIYFNSVNSLIYDVTYNPESNDTEIRIMKPSIKTDKLVVIDPGHGGSDPGATYAGIREKDLNLKIALKVNEILKSKGIKTHLTRNDDTFIPLYDRANIANDLNAALFLSIHNNAFKIAEYGTETLYYPSDKSRQFASIVQNTLVSALGMKNRGIIERPKLIVMHATKMPSALAEIAFITNDGDRKKLLDDAFLDKAAAALADSIVHALNTIT